MQWTARNLIETDLKGERCHRGKSAHRRAFRITFSLANIAARIVLTGLDFCSVEKGTQYVPWKVARRGNPWLAIRHGSI
jgi:hypothetical protein